MHVSCNIMITITWCTKTSCPPSSGVMNPQPFATLNHLHRPRRVTPMTALPLAPAAPANNIHSVTTSPPALRPLHARYSLSGPLTDPLPLLRRTRSPACAWAHRSPYLLRNLPSNWVFLQLSSLTLKFGFRYKRSFYDIPIKGPHLHFLRTHWQNIH